MAVPRLRVGVVGRATGGPTAARLLATPRLSHTASDRTLDGHFQVDAELINRGCPRPPE